MSDYDDPFAGLAPVGEYQDQDDQGFDYQPDEAPTPDAMDELIATCAQFDLNDDGNGRRFVAYFGQDVMFVPRVGWFSWTGTVWEKDPDEIAVMRKSQQVAPLVKREVFFVSLSGRQMELMAKEGELRTERADLAGRKGADGEPDAEGQARIARIDVELREIEKLQKSLGSLRAAHRRFAIQTGNSARMKSMREEASVRLSRDLEDLDARPLDINTQSGVVRFHVDRVDGARYARVELLEHDRDQLMTKIMPVTWNPDPDAPPPECPRFDDFFSRVQPDPQMRAFLMRWFALSMTGLVEQKLSFFYGMGANGKSVLVDLMARIAGDYAATAKIESLTGTNRRGGGDATPDLVPLIGARLVRAAEPDEGMRWQEGLIKDLTGGEPILVRSLHRDFVEVRPCFSLTISGNHKPDIRGTDDGIWRRLLLVLFDVQIPKEEQIPKAELDEILFAERDGIFAKLVTALMEYLERGLCEPASVIEATNEFRSESDPYGSFLDEACVVSGDPEETITARELVNAFHFWLAQRAEGAFKDRTVSLALKDRSRRWVSRRTGKRFTERKSNGTMRYDGIRFADVFKREWTNVPKDANGRAVAIVEGAE